MEKDDTKEGVFIQAAKTAATIGAAAGGIAMIFGSTGFAISKAYDQTLGVPSSLLDSRAYVATGALFFIKSCRSFFTLHIWRDMLKYGQWPLVLVATVSLLCMVLSCVSYWPAFTDKLEFKAKLILMTVMRLVSIVSLIGASTASIDQANNIVTTRGILWKPLDQIDAMYFAGHALQRYACFTSLAIMAFLGILTLFIGYVNRFSLLVRPFSLVGFSDIPLPVVPGKLDSIGRVVAFMFIAINILILPFVYGTLSEKYEFPIVIAFKIDAGSESKSHTGTRLPQGVYGDDLELRAFFKSRRTLNNES